MLYALIGVGSIGRALIRDVLDADPKSRFLAVDAEEGALKAAEALDAKGRVAARKAEATDPATLAPLLAGAAVVINCTFGARCLEILDAAIAAKVPYIDVHGTLLMNERLERHDAAKAAGITALIGEGVSPGLTNMLAGYGARQFSGPVDIDCEYVTHRPINPTEGLLETALRQFRDPVRVAVYEDGEVTQHPPFSGVIHTRFKGLDEEIVLPYTPHSEPLTVPRYVAQPRPRRDGERAQGELPANPASGADGRRQAQAGRPAGAVHHARSRHRRHTHPGDDDGPQTGLGSGAARPNDGAADCLRRPACRPWRIRREGNLRPRAVQR